MHYLSYCCRHHQTTVRVDVNLANSRFCSLTQLLFGYSDCVFQCSTVCIYDFDLVLRYRRRAVQHNRKSGYPLFYLCQDIKTQWWRNENTICISSTLFGTELVCSVRCAYRNCQRIHSCLLYKVFHILCPCIRTMFCTHFVLNSCQYSEFSFDCYIILVCVIDNLFGQSHIFFVWKRRTVNHNRRKTILYARFAYFKAVAVVEVKHNRNIVSQFLCILYSSLCHITQQGLIGILSRSCRYLKYNRAFLSYARLNDSLHLLHVVKVECGDSISALHGFGKNLSRVYQAQIFIINHRFFVLNDVVYYCLQFCLQLF